MLARALIVAIHLYRRASRWIPRSRGCLFAVSCSRHVEQAAREHGFVPALRAMRSRFAACRPGYSFEYDGSGWRVRCVDGSAIAAAAASRVVHDEAAACRLALTRAG